MDRNCYSRNIFGLLKSFHLTICALVLAGCGGLGSNSNSAPSFSSELKSNPVIEQLEGHSYTDLYLSADDDDFGDELTYSIVGGADKDLFELSENSPSVNFTFDVDYENPQDSDQDNVYEVSFEVSDGKKTDSIDVRIVVLDAIEGRFLLHAPSLVGAFLDLNDNGLLDASEYERMTTNIFGYFHIPNRCDDVCDHRLMTYYGSRPPSDYMLYDDFFVGTVIFSQAFTDRFVIISPLNSLLTLSADADAILDALEISMTLEEVLSFDYWDGALAGNPEAEQILRFNQQLTMILYIAEQIGVQEYRNNPIEKQTSKNVSPVPSFSSEPIFSGPTQIRIERAQSIYSSLDRLATDHYAELGDPIRLDSINSVKLLLSSFQLRDNMDTDMRDYVAIVVSGLNKLIGTSSIGATDEIVDQVFHAKDLLAPVTSFAYGWIGLSEFAGEMSFDTLFLNSSFVDRLPDALPPELVLLSQTNNYPSTLSLSFTVADEDSGVTQVEGALSNSECELEFARSYGSPSQASDTISFSLNPAAKSGTYRLSSLYLEDREGNGFDGLQFSDQAAYFVIDNPAGDVQPADLISYSLSVDPLNPDTVVVESVIREATGISTGSLDGTSDTFDIEVQLEDVTSSSLVSAKVLTADLIDNGDGTYTATIYFDFGSEGAAAEAELAHFRMCDVGMNLTELDKDVLEAL